MATREDLPEDCDRGDGVSRVVSGRLSLYLRELQRLVHSGHETTSSTQLGRMLGVTGAQVRKDLANFGQFGYPGVGYRCQELIAEIKRILGTDRSWPVALVGIGNLGRALVGYRGFIQQGFHVAIAFDNDPDKAGSAIEGVPIFGMHQLASQLANQRIKLAALAVPMTAAQQVADQLVQAGIEGLLNFAPVTLKLPARVHLVAVDLAVELEQLSFAVVNKRRSH